MYVWFHIFSFIKLIIIMQKDALEFFLFVRNFTRFYHINNNNQYNYIINSAYMHYCCVRRVKLLSLIVKANVDSLLSSSHLKLMQL